MARREKSQPTRRPVTASAVRIPLTDAKRAAALAAKREEWQTESWTYFDEVGEIKFATRYVGAALSKLRLFVAVTMPGADPIDVDSPDAATIADGALRDAAKAELLRLSGGSGDLSEFQRLMSMNLEVAAECYIVGWGEIRDLTGAVTQSEKWEIRSISEVTVKSGVFTVKGGPDAKTTKTLNPDFDSLLRVYQRHPRWADRPDCGMRAVLNECKALLALSQQVIATTNSRQSAGILLVPNEVSMPPATVTTPEGGEATEDDKFLIDLADQLIAPIEDPTNATAVVPMLVRGEAVHLDKFKHITLSRSDDASLDDRIEARRRNIARDLDLPPEVLLGHDATTFANAAQIDEDTFEDYMQPRAVMLVSALTEGYLRPGLLDLGFDPVQVGRVTIWFDASTLIGAPDQVEAANDAWDRNLISNAAWRRIKNFDEADAPTPNEIATRIGSRRGILTADLTAALLGELARAAGVEMPKPPEALPAGVGVTPDPAAQAAVLAQALIAAGIDLSTILGGPREGLLRGNVIAASARLHSDAGAKLAAIDRELRSKLILAATTAIDRAMEKAGNRLRSKLPGDLKAIVKTAPASTVVSTIGRGLTASYANGEELLDGAFSTLKQQFLDWGRQAQNDAMWVVDDLVGGFSSMDRETLGLRLSDSLEESWSWLEKQLLGRADAALFNPGAAVEMLGEVDPSAKVPASVIREAIARAGGATNIETYGEGSAYVAVGADGRALGGIGTGETLMRAAADRGASVEAYRWVYGPAFRKMPFDPHLALDGVTFLNFDDPALANGSGWPDGAYYMPGDHAGCVCDFEPILLSPEDAEGLDL